MVDCAIAQIHDQISHPKNQLIQRNAVFFNCTTFLSRRRQETRLQNV